MNETARRSSSSSQRAHGLGYLYPPADSLHKIGCLDDELETALFRVIQECLSNVHRHSNSRTAKVSLRHDNAHLHLEVRDEGSGIPRDKERELILGGGGVGLRGMRERIAQLGGKFSLQSSAQGTIVGAAIPARSRSQQEGGKVA